MHYYYVKHGMSPMLKSCCEEVHSKAGELLFEKCTKFRAPWNFTQYLFPDYALMSSKAVLGKMDIAYLRIDDIKAVYHAILMQSSKVVCINDCASDEV